MSENDCTVYWHSFKNADLPCQCGNFISKHEFTKWYSLSRDLERIAIIEALVDQCDLQNYFRE